MSRFQTGGYWGEEIPRRNSGRVLAVVIESTMEDDLDGLLARTAALLVRSRLVAARPLFPKTENLRNTGFPCLASKDEWLTFHDFGEFDLLVGVASRRRRDVDARADNRVVQKLLEVIQTPSDDGVLYGTIVVAEFDRAVRTRVGEAYLTQALKDWDIRLALPEGIRDPVGDPNFEQNQMQDGHHAQEGATAMIRRTTTAKAAWHEAGRASYSPGATHPMIFIHPETKEMSWALEVVGAFRQAVRLRLKGATWADVAAEVGHLIPSRALQQRPDTKRAADNKQRLKIGLAALELKFLETGRPNPRYQPETVADERMPSSALRGFLLNHNFSATEAELAPYVDTDLDGVDVRQARFDFLVNGIYRRLVKDATRSNHRSTRFMWVPLDLGPVDKRGGVLTTEEFDAIWPKPGTNQSRRGATSYAYLQGIFVADQPTRFYSEDGWVDPAQQRLIFRTRFKSNEETYVLGVAQVRSHGIEVGPTLGKVDAQALHLDVKREIERVLSKSSVPVETGWVLRVQQRRADDRSQERRVAHAEALLRRALEDYSQPHLSDRQRAMLRVICDEREAELSQLLEGRVAATSGKPSDADRPDGLWQVGSTIDLVAVLGSNRKFSKHATRAIQATARAALQDARVWIDAEAGLVRWTAQLTLPSDDQARLQTTIGGALPNRTTDRWLQPTSIERSWWSAVTDHIEPTIRPGIGSDMAGIASVAQVRKIALRIEREASAAGVILRQGIANMIVACPDWQTPRTMTGLATGTLDPTDDRLQALANLVIDDGEPPWTDLEQFAGPKRHRRLRNLAGVGVPTATRGVADHTRIGEYLNPEVIWWRAATNEDEPSIAPGNTSLGDGRQEAERKQLLADLVEREAFHAGVALRTGASRAIVHCPDWATTRHAIRIIRKECECSDPAAAYISRLLVEDGLPAPVDLSRHNMAFGWSRALDHLAFLRTSYDLPEPEFTSPPRKFPKRRRGETPPELVWWQVAHSPEAPRVRAGLHLFGRGILVAERKGRVIDRIESAAHGSGRQLRPFAARAIVHCPDWDVVRSAMRLVNGEEATEPESQWLANLLLEDGQPPASNLNVKGVAAAWRGAIRRFGKTTLSENVDRQTEPALQSDARASASSAGRTISPRLHSDPQ